MHHCFFIPCDKTTPIFEAKNLWKEYGGYFIGIGYVFPSLYENELTKACQSAQLQLHRLPMGNFTFDEYINSYKIDYLNQLKMKKQNNLHFDSSDKEKISSEIKEINLSILRKEKAQALLDHSREGISYTPLLESISEEMITEEIKNVSPGIPTGFVIDTAPLNIEGGEISVIAAPTGHGKTSFLINALCGILKHNRESKVYFFSYEESLGPLFCLALNHYIDAPLSENNRESILSYFRTGAMEDIFPDVRERFLDKKRRFFEELIESRRLNLFYSRYSAEELVGAIRFLAENDRPTAICIDYMQMLRMKDAPKGMSRQEELKQICLMLKDCAIETGLPLLIAAQFNRTVQTEEELLAQAIGEAGDIERIASLIIGLWNRRFTKEDCLEGLYAKILKARHQPTGGEEVFGFDGNRCKIENVVKRTLNDLF